MEKMVSHRCPHARWRVPVIPAQAGIQPTPIVADNSRVGGALAATLFATNRITTIACRQCVRALVLLGSVAVLLVANDVARAVGLRTVALSGQPAPGTPSGVVYRFLNSPPSLNSAGHIAYEGHLIASGVPLGEAAWSEGSGGMPQLLAREGDQAPGMPAGVRFSNLGVPTLNNQGQAAFYAIARDGDPIYSGAWTNRTGTLERVAADGMPAPGTTSGAVFNGLINGRVLFNDTGHVAFSSFVAGGGVNSTNDIGIWSDSAGPLTVVAREGDPAPGTPSGVVFDALSPPQMNTAGQLAFSGSITGSGSEFTTDGIWRGRAGDLQLVVRNGDAAPGTSSGVQFNSFGPPALNAAGHTAFLGILTGTGVTTSNDRGIWSQGAGSLALVVREGSAAPGTPSGFVFSGFGTPVLNGAGKVALTASMSGTGVGETNNSGIWAGDATGVALVVRSGTQAPGTPAGANFGAFGSVALNSFGQVAFLNSLFVPRVNRDGTIVGAPGGGVTAANDFGLWATDRDGALHLVAREGDPLRVGPGDFRTVSNLAFLTGGPNDGGARGFNDRGQIAFLATFSDGTSGLFVSNLVAVPEPSLAAMLFGLAGVVFSRRRDRAGHD